MTETERKEKSGRIVKQIRETAVYAGADCILCYVSLPEEVRTEVLIRQRCRTENVWRYRVCWEVKWRFII